MPELTKSVPRTAKVASILNPEVQWCVGEKGGITVYLGGRFPVTLYHDQWDRLFGGVDMTNDSIPSEIMAFAQENEHLLATRDSSKATTKDDDKPETLTLNTKDLGFLDAYTAEIAASQPVRSAKLMSVKIFADMNKGKVPRADGLDVLNTIQAWKDAKNKPSE
jgi:hypothetical protein